MLNRFFGGPPGQVAFRLVVISLVVGVIMTAIGISPYEIVASVRRLIQRIYDLGFDSIEWLFRYIWLGAIVVVPVWLIARLFALFGSEDHGAAKARPSEADRMADPDPGAGKG
jgi:hypothetical protein